MISVHKYSAFGLTIESCIQCPELLPAASAVPPDVRVVYGDVPSSLPGARKIRSELCQALPGQLMLDVPSSARFLVRNGEEIIIDRHDGPTDDDVRLFLLGSAFGALMHQRGILVLHGSSIKAGDGCVVFLGRSGIGKSTLATELSRRGYPSLGDDLCAVSIAGDNLPYAAASYPQAKLNPDSLEHLGFDPTNLRRVRPSDEKRAVPLQSFTYDVRLPIRQLYVLRPGKSHVTELEVVPLTGPPKIRALRDHTYRFAFLRGLALRPRHFSQIAHVAARVPITMIVRPKDTQTPQRLAAAVEADLRSHGLTPPDSLG